MQAVAQEKARLAVEKELEVARLRDQQERVADRRSEIDELRARRCASPFLPPCMFNVVELPPPPPAMPIMLYARLSS